LLVEEIDGFIYMALGPPIVLWNQFWLASGAIAGLRQQPNTGFLREVSSASQKVMVFGSTSRGLESVSFKRHFWLLILIIGLLCLKLNLLSLINMTLTSSIGQSRYFFGFSHRAMCFSTLILIVSSLSLGLVYNKTGLGSHFWNTTMA